MASKLIVAPESRRAEFLRGDWVTENAELKRQLITKACHVLPKGPSEPVGLFNLTGLLESVYFYLQGRVDAEFDVRMHRGLSFVP